MPNLRIFSFDIECGAPEGHFPKAEEDPVTMITISKKFLFGETTDFVMTWKVPRKNTSQEDPNILDIGSETVLMYENETDMLKGFGDIIRAEQPNMITGYNINDFDFPYLVKRAAILDIRTFMILSPNRQCISLVKSTFQSRSAGQNERTDCTINGI